MRFLIIAIGTALLLASAWLSAAEERRRPQQQGADSAKPMRPSGPSKSAGMVCDPNSPKKAEIKLQFPPAFQPSLNVLWYNSPESKGVVHEAYRTSAETIHSISWTVGCPITFEARPSTANVLDHWTGACEGKGLCSFVVTDPGWVSFSTKPRRYTLSIKVGGAGSGTVYSQPPGIECTKAGGSCSASFDFGTMIVLALAPDLTTYYGKFLDPMCAEQKNQCTIGIGADLAYTVLFDLTP